MGNYYDKNAEKYINATFDCDMSKERETFMRLLPPKGKILDLGCGSGRDALAFTKAGFRVTAIDSAPEMCRLASEKTGLNIQCQDFRDINFQSEFDGVWACASLVHLTSDEVEAMFTRINKALKNSGVFYFSLKGVGSCQPDDVPEFVFYEEQEVDEIINKTGFLAPKIIEKTKGKTNPDTIWLSTFCFKIPVQEKKIKRKPMIPLYRAIREYGFQPVARPVFVPEKHCQWCGNEIKGTKRTSFCSNDCSTEFNRIVTWGRHRGAYSNQIVWRDNLTCCDCGKFLAYKNEHGIYIPHDCGGEVHHVIPVEFGGDDRPENLICLCHECHQKRHTEINSLVDYIAKEKNAETFGMVKYRELLAVENRLKIKFAPAYACLILKYGKICLGKLEINGLSPDFSACKTLCRLPDNQYVFAKDINGNIYTQDYEGTVYTVLASGDIQKINETLFEFIASKEVL